MDAPYTNLLTQDDLDLINGIGFPIGARPDLHRIEDDGSLIFTVKGLQFYRVVLSNLGLLAELPGIRTKKDLYELKSKGLAILAARSDCEVMQALEHGAIAPQRREVVQESLYGTLESFIAACDRHETCRAAGDHVIPGSFKRNTAN